MSILFKLNNLATLAWFINTVVIKPARVVIKVRKERANERAERAYLAHWYPTKENEV